MSETIEVAKGAVSALVGLPTLLLIWPAMIILGWCLKRTAMPNKFIPLVVVFLPALLVCFLLPYAPGAMTPNLPHPGTEHCIRCASIGLVLGFLAWGTHRPFTKLMEKWVPGFDTNDTSHINKPTS